jgi:hypothetical protein
MGIIVLVVLLISALLNPSPAQVMITEGADEGMEAFRVETAEAVYFYQKEAGGFSSILDSEGLDWIGYRDSGNPEYPASAASDYRGLPNLVFRGDDDGAGHPGFNTCRSELAAPDTIRTVSKSGLWSWEWRFRDSRAELTVLETDPSRAYWYLYEGAPGGRYCPPEQYWGTDKGGPVNVNPDYLSGEETYGNWQWAYFGDIRVDRVLFVACLGPVSPVSTVGFLGADSAGLEAEEGMVVFGFGREKNATPLLEGPSRFIVGFYPKKIEDPEDHSALAEYMKSLLETEGE